MQKTTTVISIFVCYIISCWTMFVNGMLLICIYRNRKVLWMQKTKGISSLIFTDFLSGVNCVIFLSMQLFTSVKVYSCIVVSGSYLSTQVMMSFQILHICLQRLVAVLSKRRCTTESLKSATLRFIVLNFICISCVSIQFIWVQWKAEYTPCNLSTLFGDNMNTVCLYLILVFTIPNTCTTLIYCCVIYLLKSKGRIFPRTETNVAQDNIGQIRTRDGQIGRVGGANPQFQRYSRKAIITIGCILVLNNIALAPYLILLSLQSRSSDPHRYPSLFWVVSFLFLQTNSALSPFVYAFRVQQLREKFAEMLTEIFCCKKSMRNVD